jgi:hypothetical protein
MPAIATAARPPDPGSYVSAEWRGRARALRNRVAAAHAEWERAAMALTGPLCARDGFAPSFTKGSLRLLQARWTNLPQAWGRLRNPVSAIAGGTLSIAELRAVDFRAAMTAWNGDELSIAVALVSVTMTLPSSFSFSSKTLALIGLHALARRYGRGADRRDLAVVMDMLPIAIGAPAILRVGGDFEIAAGDGRWIGQRMALDGQPIVAVRTYVAS